MDKITKVIGMLIVGAGLLLHQAAAQNIIVVQGGGTANFFTYLDSAVSAANAGDTIYVPGYTYNIGTLVIDKQLHLYGVGHHPDSTRLTGQTYLVGNITITTGADGGSLRGIRVSGDLEFGNTTSNDNISSYTVQRCYVDDVRMGFYSASNSTNNLFLENIINTIDGHNTQGSLFANNLISRVYNFSTGNTFRNNLFFTNAGSNLGIQNMNGCLFENNIFWHATGAYDSSDNVNNCVFNNNLAAGTFGGGSTNVLSGNFASQGQSSIFSSAIGSTFSYSTDYQLSGTSIGKNGGSDGSDVGIYGGVFPYKDNTTPDNPRITSKNIGTATDNQGRLLINLTVEAQ